MKTTLELVERLRSVLVGALAVFFIAGQASAAVIFDNGVTIDNGLHADRASVLFRLLADDFVLQAGANTIRDIHWTGVYGLDGTPPALDDFTIEMFVDVSGDPAGSPFMTLNIGNAVNRTDTGTDLAGFDIYSYSVAISPLTLTAGATHWLSIYNNTASDPDDDWYWAVQFANAGDPQGWIRVSFNPTQGWGKSSANADFQLTGDVAAVPEPVSVYLVGLGLGLAGAAALRRRRGLTTRRCANCPMATR